MPTRYNVSRDPLGRPPARARASASASRSSRSRSCARTSARSCPAPSGLAAENLQARIRGVIVMTLSNQHGCLVLTTSNKSETAVGYSTLYGDTAGGFAPIKDVPKTRVFALSRWLNERAGARGHPASRSSTGRRRPSCATTSATTSRCRRTSASTRSSRRTSSATSRPPRSPRAGIADLETARARRPHGRPRGVQAAAGGAGAEAAPEGVRPRPARADHQPLQSVGGSYGGGSVAGSLRDHDGRLTGGLRRVARSANALTALDQPRSLLRTRKPPPTARYCRAAPALARRQQSLRSVDKPLRSFVAAGQGSLTVS